MASNPTDDESFDRTILSLNQETVSHEQAAEFVRTLGVHVGIEDLEIDEDGAAELTIDGEIGLSLVHRPPLPGLMVAMPLPEVPVDEPRYLTALLEANMAWPLTRGGVFGMLPGRAEVMLCWFLPIADGDPGRADRTLAGLVEVARSWRARLAAARAREEGAAAAGALPTHALRV
jgi:hypothetical protein